MKISIVTAYHNRRTLFTKTLESLTNTKHIDFEVIAVDDASNEDQRIEDLSQQFPFLKVFRINPINKWWCNPCIPNNIGFHKASGDIVVIQNPECLHLGDVLYDISINWAPNRYLVYGCYALSKTLNDKVSIFSGNDSTSIRSVISPTNDIPLEQCPHMDRWYQHSEYSPRCFNFCTVIGRDALKGLGGFDEEYADGIGYDDTEFIHRIRMSGLDVRMIDNPIVVHQWHPFTNYGGKNWDLHMKNKELYENKTLYSAVFSTSNLRTLELFEDLA